VSFLKRVGFLGLIFLFCLGSGAFAQDTEEQRPGAVKEEAPEATELKAPEPAGDKTSGSEQKGAPKESRLPAREIERPLVLPDEVSELRVGVSYFDAKKYFDEDSKSQSLEDSQDWRLLTVQLEMGYGVADWLEVGAGIPYYSGKIFEAEGDNLGDLYGFAKFRVLKNESRTAELTLNFKASFPTGDSDIKMKLEKKNYFQENLRTGDPLVDFFVGPAGRWSFNKFALRGGFEYGYRMEGKIKSGMEGLEDTDDFDPGESFSANFEFLYQVLDKLVAGVSLDYFQQDANKLEGESLDDDWYLFQLRPGIEIQFTQDYDLAIQSAVPVSGKNQAEAYPIIVLWKSRI